MARHKKPKTNRQVLAKLIKEAEEFTLAFIRERLLHIVELYPDNEETRKQFKGSFVHPNLYINAAKEVKKAIDFDD